MTDKFGANKFWSAKSNDTVIHKSDKHHNRRRVVRSSKVSMLSVGSCRNEIEDEDVFPNIVEVGKSRCDKVGPLSERIVEEVVMGKKKVAEKN